MQTTVTFSDPNFAHVFCIISELTNNYMSLASINYPALSQKTRISVESLPIGMRTVKAFLEILKERTANCHRRRGSSPKLDSQETNRKIFKRVSNSVMSNEIRDEFGFYLALFSIFIDPIRPISLVSSQWLQWLPSLCSVRSHWLTVRCATGLWSPVSDRRLISCLYESLN